MNSQLDLENNLLTTKKLVVSKEGNQQLLKIDNSEYIWKERQVQSKICPYKNIIFTTYFTSKADPQQTNKNKKNSQVSKNDIKYIAPWYESIQKLNLNGIVFHDGLSQDFIKKYTTQNVQFVKCTLGNYSLNDERFFIYYQYLLKHCPKVEYVLMTDGNDVTFTRDPFELIRSYPDDTLFVGRNHGDLHRQYLLAGQGNSMNKFMECYKGKVANNFFNLPIYNAGILGGSLFVTIYQLNRMIKLFSKCKPNENNSLLDMQVLNYTIYNFWYPKTVRGINKWKGQLFSPTIYQFCFYTIPKILYKLPKIWKLANYLSKKKEHDNKKDNFANTENIVTSYPLCSAFRKYEEDSDAYIIHK